MSLHTLHSKEMSLHTLHAKKVKPYWTNEDKLKLIALAQERPVLWNTYYPYYRELNQRRTALEEIKNALGDKFCGKLKIF